MLHCQSDIQNQRRFFCQKLHIMKNFRQVEWNVTTSILCGFWMWVFNLTLQQRMETRSYGKGDGRWFFVEHKWFQDILYPDWNTNNLTDLSTKVWHLWWKTVGSSFHRGVFSCVFFLWGGNFRSWECLELWKKWTKIPLSHWTIERFNEVKCDNFPPKPTVLQQRLRVSSNSQMQKDKVCPKSGWQSSDSLPCQSFCLPMESMGLVYLPKNYHIQT